MVNQKKLNRHSYVKHILEIVGNIKKQQAEIQKVFIKSCHTRILNFICL